MRITRHQLFMEIAQVVAKRSTCCRLNVGAVIVNPAQRIISIGYNGAPPGAPHCLGNDCPGRNGCHIAIHAEENAFNYIPAGETPHVLYVTHSPCPVCSERIERLAIKNVIFSVPYRRHEHIDDAKGYYQLTPAGFLIEWASQLIVEAP